MRALVKVSMGLALILAMGITACDCGGEPPTGIDASNPRRDGGVVPYDAGRDASVVDRGSATDSAGTDTATQDATQGDTGAGQDAALPPCTDDALEDNDDPTQATQLAPGTLNAQICSGDDDMFAVALNVSQKITARIDFQHSAGDLDLYLFAGDGSQLDSSETTDDTEQVEATVDTAGAYYVVVTGYSGAVGAYTLTVTVEDVAQTDGGTPTCQDDSFEENDTLASSAVVGAGTYQAQLCAGDPDFFGVQLNAGDRLVADLAITSPGQNLDVQVLSPAGVELGASTGTSASEHVEVTATLAGRHGVRIFGAAASDASAYDLTLAVTPATTTCQDDSFEDNDDSTQATSIAAGTLSGKICAGDEDWFALTLAAGDQIQANLTFVHAAGDLNIELLRPDLSVLSAGSSTTDNELLTGTVATGGTYMLRVLGMDNAENAYQLVVAVTPGSTCANDAFELNDTSAQAAALTAGSHTAKICAGDQDWYRVSVNANSTLRVDLTFTHAAGNIDLKIFDATATTLLASSLSTTDNEQASVVAQSSGDLLVQVLGATGAVNSYGITVTVTPGTATCTDDGLEDNDSRSAAVDLQPGTYTAHLCPGDDDWYRFSLNTGDRMVVDLTFSHASGNIDARILDSAGLVLSAGTTTTDNEHVEATATTAGSYFLAVTGAATVNNGYGLTVAVTPSSTCRDDAFEENDNQAAAAALGNGTYDGQICPADDDFFAVNLNVGDIVEARIEFTSSAGDLDLHLLSPTGQVLDSSTTASGNTETVQLTATSAGRYAIRVFGYRGAANSYRLTLTLTPVVPVCREDGYEENDARDSAATVVAGTVTGQICTGDDDWFGLNLNTNDVLSIDLLFTHASGDLDLALYNPAGTLARSSGSTTDNEQISNYTVPAAGRYTIRVRGFGGAENSYRLVLNVVPYVPPCPEDNLEDNDTQATATAYGNQPVTAQICAGDADWFKVSLNAGDTLSALLDFSHASGDLDLALRNPAGSLVASSTSVTDDETIAAYVAPAAGVYALRVYGMTGVSNAYTLTVTVTPAIPVCTEDSYEENDTQATARAYPGTAVLGQICSGDADWYSVVLNAGDTLQAELQFTHSNGDLDLRLYSPGAALLRTSGGASNTERIDYTTTAAGTYAVQAYGYSGAENSYTLTLTVVPATPTCVDDANENNDTQATARSLPSNNFNGQICAGDDDYYKVDLSAGETLVVDLIFTHSQGDLDMRLLDPAGAIMVSSTTGTDNERISFPVRLSGMYAIRIYGYGGAENAYTLRTTVSAELACPADDNLEQNDTFDQARVAAVGSLVGIICTGDDDYFKIDLPEGGLLSAELTFDGSVGDLDLYLYNANRTQIAVSNSVASQELVRGYSDTATTFYLRVRGYNGVNAGSYALALGLEQSPFYAAGSPKGCPGDDGLANSNLLAATQLRTGEDVDGVICNDGFDYYAVSLEAGQRLDVVLGFAQVVDNLDLVLLAPGETTVASSEGTGDNETLSYTVPQNAPGTYFLVAFGATAADENWYNLRVGISGGGSTCVNETTEPNNTKAQARGLAPVSSAGGQRCASDTDYYKVTVGAGQTLTGVLMFAHSSSCDLDLVLESDTTTVDSSTGTTDREEVQVVAPTLSTQYTYYFKVYSVFSTHRCPYSLVLDTTGP
ncbi:MAG: PPC domain-containing protein [Pseudomonadota bacterium]